MNINTSSRGFYFFKVFLVLIFLCLLSAQGMAANYPLEIIQPQPNLDTKNRFYKAYPGLEYNVRLAVAGGAYPFQYSFTQAPAGMTIDKRGEISWQNPIASGTPYPVTVSVTDSEATVRSVSWSITVITDGFLFVDAVNGKTAASGGTGTRTNPWKTMKDVYGGDVYDAKWSTHHPGSFVYWREGQYILDPYKEACTTGECRVPLSNNHPMVWLAYPGERPEINFNAGGMDAYLLFGGTNIYLDGFDFNINSNSRAKGIVIGNSGNFTVRRNIFRGMSVNCTTGGNPAQLFIAGGMGQYNSVQDNIARESCGYWLLGYDSPKTVIENNHISTNMPLPLSPKDNIQYWTIRGNHIEGQTTSGAILLQEYGYFNEIEISFNVIKMSQSNGVALRVLTSDPGGPVYVHRNTIVGHVKLRSLTTSKGPWTFTENVLINNSLSTDKMTRIGTVDDTRIITSNNLLGSSSDNIVDSQGYLTSGFSKYVGTHGHQIGKRPMPPTALQLTK